MRFNTEPFLNLNKRIASLKVKAIAKAPKAPPKYPLVKTEKLMYDYNLGGIKFVDTGEYFTGKFEIPADKFVREVKVVQGQEVSNLVMLKSGGNYYLEIVGHNPKYFRTSLSEAEQEVQVAKMLEADQKTYDSMIKRFADKESQQIL